MFRSPQTIGLAWVSISTITIRASRFICPARLSTLDIAPILVWLAGVCVKGAELLFKMRVIGVKNKTFKKRHARIQAAFERWITALGLKWWDIEIWYYTDRKAFRKVAGASGPNTAMSNRTRWEYGMATIMVNIKALAHLSDTDLDRAVVHELLHTLVNEMRAGGIDHEERVVTGLTKAIFWVRSMEE